MVKFKVSLKSAIILFISLLISMYYFDHKTSTVKKYQILEEILAHENFGKLPICCVAEKIEISSNNTSDFNVYNQIALFFKKNFQESVLEKKYSNNLNIISDCGKQSGLYYKISLPIISSDEKMAIIKIKVSCNNCLLGDSSGEFVFRKSNGKWQKIKSYNVWIS